MSKYADLCENIIDRVNLILDSDSFYKDFLEIVSTGTNTFKYNRKTFERDIDSTWVKTIEKYLISLDTVIRNPRTFIEKKEELVPIELSKQVSADSIKHLSQHTNLINSIEGDKITPSKLLNVFNEESYNTYENKFIYTLINRLMTFINIRYSKLEKSQQSEQINELDMKQTFKANEHEEVSISLNIGSKVSAGDADTDQNIFLRVTKIKDVVMGFYSSQFCQIMKEFGLLRPPIMRTNAILKNPDLNNCLNLWIFLESYDKVGYFLNSVENSEKLKDDYVDNLYILSALNFVLFKYYTQEEESDAVLNTKLRSKISNPKYLKTISDEFAKSFDIDETEFRKILLEQVMLNRKERTLYEKNVKKAITDALKSEKQYKKEFDKQERIRLAQEAKKEAARKELEEKRRLKEEERQKQIAIKEAALRRFQEEENRIIAERIHVREAKNRIREEIRLEKERIERNRLALIQKAKDLQNERIREMKRKEIRKEVYKSLAKDIKRSSTPQVKLKFYIDEWKMRRKHFD